MIRSSGHGVGGAALAAVIALGLAACGGGSGDSATATPPQDNTQRATAASATASSTTNACAAVAPFYWQVGDVNGMLAGGSVNAAGSATSYTSSTVMGIASASKWLYGAYVVERKAGVPSADDIRFLNFRSGYTNFTACMSNQTVGECVAYSTNGDYSPANDGKFLYDGGHMEKHASLLGLDPLDNTTLAAEIRGQLGSDIAMSYSQPQLAGGVRTSADNYARYLRKLLAGQLRMSAALGSNAVCTNPLTCSTAVGTPIPTNESWHYSVGHWVEDDPVVGDGSFSSPGAFGFYPWVDAARRYYGIVARQATQTGSAIESVYCGRIIRKAWVTGVAQ